MRPRCDLARKPLQRRRAQRLAMDPDRAGIGDEGKALQLADILAFDQHFAIVVDGGGELLLLTQPLHQHTGAPVDKALRQLLVQRIRQPVLDGSRALLPEPGIRHPLRAVRDIGPRPDMRDALRDRVDLALDIVEPRDMAFQPRRRQHALMAHQVLEEVAHELRVFLHRDLAEVRDLADLPEQLQHGRSLRLVLDARIGRQDPQHQLVILRARPAQPPRRRQLVEALVEPRKRRVIEVRVAPLDDLHRIEAVVLDGLDQVAVQRLGIGCDAERAVIHVASRASGNLRQFVGAQGSPHGAVELLRGGKGDMVDVHVEPHADRVRRNQEVDIARLVERDLRIARARRQRAHDHRSTAALPAHQLCNRIDRIRREPDDGRSAGQACQLARAGIGKVGKARARDELHARQQLLQQRAHRVRAKEDRLRAAPRVQEPVREHMAAIRVLCELDLVHRNKLGPHVHGHRFHRRHPVRGRLGHDLFLARDQRHAVVPLHGGDPLIDLARQQPQRQADDAALVGHHPLDGVVGLAGIRGAENGRHAAIRDRHVGECPGSAGPLALRSPAMASGGQIFPPSPVEKNGIIWINYGTKRARIAHEGKFGLRSRTIRGTPQRPNPNSRDPSGDCMRPVPESGAATHPCTEHAEKIWVPGRRNSVPGATRQS